MIGKSMKKKFPSDFIFGIGDADLQVIGEDYTRKEEDSQQSMWDHFARTSGRCHENTPPGIAIDRYHRFAEDISIMKELGLKHYRTSVSMSRLLKQNGEINPKALAWYRNYFTLLREAGITIYVTLYHWELPQFLSAAGGWKNRSTVDYLVKHAETVVEHLGEFIEEYFILNEPRCSSLVSYYMGNHAPGETNLKSALTAAHHLLLAQGRIVETLLSKNSSLKLSTVINVGPRYALSEDSLNLQAAQYADGHKNTWFLDPIFLGKYPETMVELYGDDMPPIHEGDMETIQVGNKLHTLALNYYRGDIVTYNEKKKEKFDTMLQPGAPTTDLGWGIYLPPYYKEGLYDILQQVYYSYRNHGLKQIYIAENGIAVHSPWDGKETVIQDNKRIYFLQEHIRMIHDAILRGVPIKGYFTWTLMDNYEWAEGYRPDSCFGLIHVDRKSLQRIWKKSAYWYKEVLATHALPEEKITWS
jgi:beta-glucosidase